MQAGREYFSTARTEADQRVLKKLDAYVHDDAWAEAIRLIKSPTTCEAAVFLQSDGTTKKTLVCEDGFTAQGTLKIHLIKWFVTHAQLEAVSDLEEDPISVWLPTDFIGTAPRPKAAADVDKLPPHSTLRVSEGFDHASVVVDLLEPVLTTKFKKPVTAVLPTDSGGSTENQHIYTVLLGDDLPGDAFIWPDPCKVHLGAISGKKGFEKWCRIMGRDPRAVEKQLWLLGWGINDKNISTHRRVAVDFDEYFPRWGNGELSDDWGFADFMRYAAGKSDAVENLAGHITRKRGRVVTKVNKEVDLPELTRRVHRLFSKVALPVWARWLTFRMFCAHVSLLLALGLATILHHTGEGAAVEKQKYEEDFAAQHDKYKHVERVREEMLAMFPGKGQLSETQKNMVSRMCAAAQIAGTAMDADIVEKNFIERDAQEEFVSQLRTNLEDALHWVLNFEQLRPEPRDLAHLVVRRIGRQLKKLGSRDLQLRHLRAFLRVLDRHKRCTAKIEHRIGRGKKNAVRKMNNGACGLPTVSCNTNRKDLFDARAEIRRQLSLWAEREKKAKPAEEGDDTLGGGAGRRRTEQNTHRLNDQLLSVFLRDDRIKGKDLKTRMATANGWLSNPEEVKKAMPAAQIRLADKQAEEAEQAEEADEDPDEEEETLRSRSSLQAAQGFYDRVEAQAIDKLSRMADSYDYGVRAVGRRCDRAQQTIFRKAPEARFKKDKPLSCYAIGRLAASVHKKTKKGASAEEVVDFLGGLPVPELPQNDVGVIDADVDVRADEQAAPEEGEQASGATAAATLGLGLVAEFRVEGTDECRPFLILGVDLQNYHFTGVQLVARDAAAQGRREYALGRKYLHSVAVDSDELDLSSTRVYLSRFGAPVGGAVTVVAGADQITLSKRKPPAAKPVVVAKQEVAKNLWEKRLQERAMAQRRQPSALLGSGVVRENTTKRPAAPDNVRPAAAPAPDAKRQKVEWKPLADLTDDQLAKHNKEKANAKGKLKRSRSVEGFSVSLWGSISTQKKQGRAYEAVDCRITDAELKEKFLAAQKRGGMELLARAAKQAHRMISFKDGEEQFVEAVGLLWCARTRFILDRTTTYMKAAGFENTNLMQARLQYASAEFSAITDGIRQVVRSCGKVRTNSVALIEHILAGTIVPTQEHERSLRRSFERLGALMLTLLMLCHTATMLRTVRDYPAVVPENQWSAIMALLMSRCVIVSGAACAGEVIVLITQCAQKYTAQLCGFESCCTVAFSAVYTDRKAKDAEQRYKSIGTVVEWINANPLRFPDPPVFKTMQKMKETLTQVCNAITTPTTVIGRLRGAQGPLRENAPNTTPGLKLWSALVKALEKEVGQERVMTVWNEICRVLNRADPLFTDDEWKAHCSTLHQCFDKQFMMKLLERFELDCTKLTDWVSQQMTDARNTLIEWVPVPANRPSFMKIMIAFVNAIQDALNNPGISSEMSVSGVSKGITGAFSAMVKLALKSHKLVEDADLVRVLQEIATCFRDAVAQPFACANDLITKYYIPGAEPKQHLCLVVHIIFSLRLLMDPAAVRDDSVSKLMKLKDLAKTMLADHLEIFFAYKKMLAAFVTYQDRDKIATIEQALRDGDFLAAQTTYCTLSEVWRPLCNEVQDRLQDRISKLENPNANVNVQQFTADEGEW
eukprot:g12385.t1